MTIPARLDEVERSTEGLRLYQIRAPETNVGCVAAPPQPFRNPGSRLVGFAESRWCIAICGGFPRVSLGSFGCTRLSAADNFGTLRRPRWLRSAVARSPDWFSEPRDEISDSLASFGHFRVMFFSLRAQYPARPCNGSTRKASQVIIARWTGHRPGKLGDSHDRGRIAKSEFRMVKAVAWLPPLRSRH